ncbi:MAG: protoporphyrinogen oxidase, partial [Terriglobia bacterium]
MAEPACKIAILGGGVTGLTAAYKIACARQAGAPVDEFLLEADSRLGGLIQTERMEGFSLEAGPDSFLTGKMEATGLLQELGLASQLTTSNDASRRTYILWRGRLEPLPEGLAFFVPTRLSAVISSRLIPLSSKLKILWDAAVGHKAAEAADESAADFVRRRLGAGVLHAIADPLLAGVYGGDSEKLSARAVLPALVALDRQNGSLVRGMLKAKRTAGPQQPVFTTIMQGLDELPRALAAKLDARAGPQNSRLRLNHRVEAIELNSPDPAADARAARYTLRCDEGKTCAADAVIFALPAPVCARLLRPLDAALADELSGIPYTPAVTVAIGYRAKPANLPTGFGFLVPRAEGRKLLACTFVQAKFRHRAPEGSALLRCFLGGAHHREILDWSDGEIISQVERELREILGITQQPLFHRI